MRTCDAGYWGIALFLPLIPLGTRHIERECRHCTRHIAIKGSVWKRDAEAAKGPALEAFAKSPNDPQSALEVLSAAVFFLDRDLFRDVLAKLSPAVRDDPQVAMMLANGHQMFEEVDLARPYVQHVLRHDLDGLEVPQRIGLAEFVMRNGKPADGERLLAPLIAGGVDADTLAGRPFHMMQLVGSYQTAGQPADAQRVLDQLVDLHPELAGSKEVTKLTAAIAKGKPAHKSRYNFLGRNPTYRHNGTFAWLPAVLATGLVLAITYFLYLVYFVD
ncbi:MAG: hypothetical protein AAGK78_01915, partial [Planctomycetota bacterium]